MNPYWREEPLARVLYDRPHYAGRDGRVWVAGGYSGHGNVLGFACGQLVADAMLGDAMSPQLELLAPERFDG